MRFTTHTFFPLTLVLIGVMILLSSGDEPLSKGLPIQLGYVLVPVGLVIASLGAWLYYRSRDK